MVFAGTLITSGRGIGVAVATGCNTEVGKLMTLVREAKEPKTFLQLALKVHLRGAPDAITSAS